MREENFRFINKQTKILPHCRNSHKVQYQIRRQRQNRYPQTHYLILPNTEQLIQINFSDILHVHKIITGTNYLRCQIPSYHALIDFDSPTSTYTCI